MDALLVEKTGPHSLRVFGELDLAKAGDLEKILFEEVASGEDLRIDLSEVDFMDSAAIGVFARAANALQGKGRLILVAPTHAVRLALEMIRLDARENVEIED
jgi:anti-anti-sigma factor